ncbi:glucosaminidase domain-containing protein [Staphylococcus nepalensis]|uniref:glucosaminidase domain-containing protein n=1 Tax=Staphylococcus nepalensis TaxID=214473 RepID=UPI000E6959E8|nr:GW dipeptide domain-containing protein [Staphylococcus nepalensis]RIO41984.1 autolysin [Staphylococcus nepalensis]
MTKKKLTYKVPSIVALTLAGTALTTHHAHAADNNQNQTSSKNVLDDGNTLKQGEEIKSEISKPTTNISGTQIYNDPTQVQALSTDEPENYDAQLDELDKNTSSQNTYNAQNQEEQINSEQKETETNETSKQSLEKTSTTAEQIQQDLVEPTSENETATQAEKTSDTQYDQVDNITTGTEDNNASHENTETESDKTSTKTGNINDAQVNGNTASVANSNASNNDAETQSEDTTPSNQSVNNDNSGEVETDDSTTVAKDNDTANDETEAKSDEVASQKEDTNDAKHAQDNDTTTNVKDNNTSNDAETQSEDTTPSNQLVDNDNSNEVETDDPTTVAKDNDAANDETEAKSDEVDSQKEDTNDAKHAQNNDTTTNVKDNNTSNDAETQSEDTTPSNQLVDNDNSDDVETDDPTTVAKDNDAANDETEAKSDEVDSQKEDTSDTKHIQAVNNKTTNVADSKFSNDKVETKSDKVSTPSPSVSTDIEENDSTNSDNNTSQEIAHVYSNASAPKLRMARSVSSSPTTATRSAVSTKSATKSALPKYTPKVNSSINNYIRNNNFQAPNYEQDIASYLPKYQYRYGKPEGIVMHDTANDNSTITGEINYMKNNYNSAFVHAYVDGNRIIETANTDYLAWGAGPAANDRFIHVELVHTHDYDSFARSINNYADYAATNLQYYGLAPDSAEYDGVGTVWTHQAVSKYLGGSDHTDPHGYLANHNYSYDELYDLIYEKYLIKTGQAAAWGSSSSGSTSGSKNESNNSTTKPNTGKLTVSKNDGVGRINTNNNGLYTTVYDQNGKKTNRTNQTLKVTKSATLGDKNFYLVSDYNNGNLIGWVHQADVDYNTAKTVTKHNQTYKIKPGEVVYTVPWGTSSQKAGTVSGTSNQTFKATKQQQIGKTNYVYGTVNNLSGWVSVSKLSSTNNTATSPTTNTGQLTVNTLTNKQGTVAKSNHGVYTSVYDKQGVQKSYVNGNTYKLSKKATLGNNSFYLITDNKTNTNLGWMQTRDITVKEAATQATSTPTKSVSKIGQLNTNNAGIKTTVYDQKGKDASKFAGRTFTVTKQRTQGNNTYVLIQNSKQNTPIGWVNTKDINTRNLSKTKATNGQYTVKGTNNGLYAIPWGTKAQQLDTQNNIKHNNFNASKSVFVDKDEYLYGNVNNKTGWVSAKDLNAVQSQSDITPQKFDYIIYNANGSYYLDPNSTKAAGSLKDFHESIFTVFEKQIINGVTWYHGKLSNGKVVWIKENDLRKELVKYYKSNLTLDQAVALQHGLKFKPQIQRTPGKWEDATANEIKNAMDSNKLAKDPTQKYQFLRLDKAQNISGMDLDKLLVGKGILEGQGEAFSEAAQAYNINEVYLVSHALLETGNGTSTLANGGDVVNNKVVTDGSKKYYNMFGIGAVDSDAVKQGFVTAKNNGWDTVKKAIVGGAKFIANSYINQGQNTLYKMRWNPDNPGVHQYATDVAWASHNATRIKGFYDSMDKLGKYFDVDTYK